mmetsp:Transcript_22828/g.58116  ORF Transcript_22828/g.58116 Transcript_22828/m.58116 type:complete len:341 (+) Transcript_22828:437-1459(+)
MQCPPLLTLSMHQCICPSRPPVKHLSVAPATACTRACALCHLDLGHALGRVRPVVLAHLVQVAQHGAPRGPVVHGVVLDAPALGLVAQLPGDRWAAELRHGGEQVVDDLVVEEAHHPVDRVVAGRDVHRVVHGKRHPVLVVAVLHHGHEGVRQREVAKQAHARQPVAHHEQRVALQEGGAAKVHKQHGLDHVRGEHEEQGRPVLLDGCAQVQVVHPVQPQQAAAHHGHEGPRLQAQPQLGHGQAQALARLLHAALEEAHQRQRVQVHVVVDLLGRGVVPVVHAVPLEAACGETQADGEGLDELVNLGDGGEAGVATLMLNPATLDVGLGEQNTCYRNGPG